jgi:hypothetical protein
MCRMTRTTKYKHSIIVDNKEEYPYDQTHIHTLE